MNEHLEGLTTVDLLLAIDAVRDAPELSKEEAEQIFAKYLDIVDEVCYNEM